MLATEKARDADTGIVDSSFIGSATDLPSLFHGWQTKMQGPATRTHSVVASKDLAPSPTAPAPSIVGRGIHRTNNLEPSVSPNDSPRYMKSPKHDPNGYPYSAYPPKEHTVERDPLLLRGTLFAQQSSLESGPIMSLKTTNVSSVDGLKSNRPGKVSEADLPTTPEEVQEKKDSVSVTRMSIPDSPYLSATGTGPPDVCEPDREGISRKTKTPPSKASFEIDSESIPPIRKLCIHCRRPILTSSSMCTKCLQMKEDDKELYAIEEKRRTERRGTVELASTARAAVTQNACISCTSKGCQCDIQNPCQNYVRKDLGCVAKATAGSPTKKSHFQDDVAGPFSRPGHNAVSGSPFIPETPEFLSDKTIKSLFSTHDERMKTVAMQQRTSASLIPQKRPSIRSVVTENEHCFSKKRRRVFRPVIKSISTNMPLTKVNKLPPTPESGSPCLKHNLRDAAVQTSVETVHRGTSPISTSNEVTESLKVFAKQANSPYTQLEQATCQQGDVSVVDGAQCEDTPFRPSSARRLQKRPKTSGKCNVLKQQAKELAHRDQRFEEAQAPIARLQSPAQSTPRSPKYGSIAQGENSCKPEHDATVESNHSIDTCDRLRGTGCDWASSDELALLNTLRNRGVLFEEDSSSESDIGMPPPRTKPIPKGPSWRSLHSSTDLFSIAPTLDPRNAAFDVEQKRKEIAARPFRKHRRMNMSYLRQERGENVHAEANRALLPRLVKAVSTVAFEPGDPVDKNGDATGTEGRTEVEIGFSAFIGAPAKPMAMLTKDKQLAFRDGTRSVKGGLPRAREKYIITNRSVACMEN